MRKFNPWGLLVLAVGVLLLLQAVGIETAGIWDLFWKIVWPVVVIARACAGSDTGAA